MNKSIFVLALLLTISFSLRIFHQEDAPATPTTPTEEPPKTEPTTPTNDDQLAKVEKQKQIATQAYARLINFISADPKLQDEVLADDQPTDDQTKKIDKFMVNDPYFQLQLLNKLKANTESAWLQKLSEKNQITFLKFGFGILNNANNDKAKVYLDKLLNDPEVGPAVKQQFGEPVTIQKISAAINISSQ